MMSVREIRRGRLAKVGPYSRWELRETVCGSSRLNRRRVTAKVSCLVDVKDRTSRHHRVERARSTWCGMMNGCERVSHRGDRLDRITSRIVSKVSSDWTCSHHALIRTRNANNGRLHRAITDSEIMTGRHWRKIVVVHRRNGKMRGRIDRRDSWT